MNPVEASIVATEVLEEDHVPPAVPLELYVVVLPAQMEALPETVPADTVGLTVTIALALTGEPQLVTV